MSKSSEKREVIQRADKMAKPNKSVRDFNFPNHGVTIQAGSLKEATEKLKASLKPKPKSDE